MRSEHASTRARTHNMHGELAPARRLCSRSGIEGPTPTTEYGFASYQEGTTAPAKTRQPAAHESKQQAWWKRKCEATSLTSSVPWNPARQTPCHRHTYCTVDRARVVPATGTNTTCICDCELYCERPSPSRTGRQPFFSRSYFACQQRCATIPLRIERWTSSRRSSPAWSHGSPACSP